MLGEPESTKEVVAVEDSDSKSENDEVRSNHSSSESIDCMAENEGTRHESTFNIDHSCQHGIYFYQILSGDDRFIALSFVLGEFESTTEVVAPIESDPKSDGIQHSSSEDLNGTSFFSFFVLTK